MSILHECDEGWLISHPQFIRRLYSNTFKGVIAKSFGFDDQLFAINVPFTKTKNEASTPILKKFRSFQRGISVSDWERFFRQNNDANTNKSGLDFSKHSYMMAKSNELTNCIGGNNSSEPIIHEINKQNYLFPEKSKFFCKNVSDLSICLENFEFEFILIDPPWWNKSVRRRKRYNRSDNCYDMLSLDDIKSMPINSLLDKDKGLVAIWCTNSEDQNSQLINEILPSWNLNYLATWFWIKVTLSGIEVCPFSDGCKEKQPYEKLIFANRTSCTDYAIPDEKIIVSVPSLLHSHKPPLYDILAKYVPVKHKCLEIFARYLMPNWTSYGLESTLFQHDIFYSQL